MLKKLKLTSKSERFSLESDFYSLVQKYWGNENGYFVAYLDYKVLIGKFCATSFQGEKFDPKFVQRLRLFHQSKELYIWRQDKNTFCSRLRVDGQGDDVDVIDAWQVIYGTKIKDGVLTEDRGTHLVIPFTDIKESDLPIKIHTRNYIGYNKLGQAGYEDCRFVAFTTNDNKSLGGD